MRRFRSTRKRHAWHDMSRAFLIVLDSLGVGGAPDAGRYGDVGADTLGHIAQRCASGDADRAGVRRGGLHTPHLASLGLAEACRSATGFAPDGIDAQVWHTGMAGCAAEVSAGKDSQTGHWEIAGIETDEDWGYFPKSEPCFPPGVIDALCERAQLPGVLGQRHDGWHDSPIMCQVLARLRVDAKRGKHDNRTGERHLSVAPAPPSPAAVA